MKERSIVCEAYNDLRHVTLFRCYRNFQHWYEMEVFITKASSSLKDSYTYSREYHCVDEAFSKFDREVKTHTLTILDKQGA
jgi:hypothetical protein